VSHYFDHAATTPIRPAAVEAWLHAAEQTGNAAAIHGAGRAARRIVEEARERIGEALGTPASTIIFTSGGTEADNLAILGVARARRQADPARNLLLISPIEHHGVRDAACHLLSEGFSIHEMPLTDRGVVNAAATADAMRLHADELALASLMAVNNETGVIQPAQRLAAVAHDELGLPFHCDMVQAHGQGPSLADGQCTAALASHKLGGPMGVGALIVPRGTPLQPTTYGGGQESRLRSGTVPVALVAGFAAAVVEARRTQDAETARLQALSRRLEDILIQAGGTIIADKAPRSTQITFALFPGCLGQDLVVLLDAHDIFVSTGAACTAGVPHPSPVLLAMGCSEAEAMTGLRFSLGWTSTEADLDALSHTLADAIEKAHR
jgi:cysteine desulfurase